MSFFSKVMFKLYLNVFFSWFTCPKYLFFFLQSCILYKNPRRKTNLNFYKIREISTEKWVSKVTPQASEIKKFHRNWNLNDIWRVSTRTKTVFRVSRSLCSQRWRILKITFFWPSKVTPKINFQTRRYLMILQHIMCA